MHCMKLNLKNYSLNTIIEDRIDVELFIRQYANRRLLQLNYIFSQVFVTSTGSRSWNWTQILCISLLLRRNWKIVSEEDLKKKQSASDCNQKTAVLVFLLMQLKISTSLTSCGRHKKMTSQILVMSKKSSDAERRYVYVARLCAAMILPQTNINSVALFSINV